VIVSSVATSEVLSVVPVELKTADGILVADFDIHVSVLDSVT
jgi:hypothetical protein